MTLLDSYLYQLIEERRASGDHPGDLLDMLLEARDEETGEGMNNLEIRDEDLRVSGAGHGPTAVTLTWAWSPWTGASRAAPLRRPR